MVAVSPVYETAPVGGPEQPDYLNAVVAVDTDAHRPRAARRSRTRLEAEAERVRTVRWGPRTLDVDVLLVGDERVDEPDLVVPHPRMAERAFVLRAPGRPRSHAGGRGSRPDSDVSAPDRSSIDGARVDRHPYQGLERSGEALR